MKARTSQKVLKSQSKVKRGQAKKQSIERTGRGSSEYFYLCEPVSFSYCCC